MTAGHLTAEEAKVAAELVRRLKQRRSRNGTRWTLDLRHRRFGGLGRVTLFYPSGPSWPEAGHTTDDRAAAVDWIMMRGGYAQYIARRKRVAGNGLSERLTVAEAADQYLKHLESTLGRLHNTCINRLSAFRCHVNPVFGHTPLVALERKAVREFLGKLTIQRQGRAVPAALRTRDNTRAALLALWHFTYPDDACPYFGISLADPRGVRARRERIVAGDVREVIRPKAFDADEVADILLTAMWYDAHVRARPCQRSRFVPLTSEALAVAFATGMRIGEISRWRGKHLMEREGVALVAGTKNLNALRVIPLQTTLRPWLARIRAKVASDGGDTSPTQHVLPMMYGKENRELCTSKQLIRRFAEVMRLAGHKIDQKAAHACRNYHATVGKLHADLVDLPSLKSYLGHVAVGGATERYVDRTHVDLIVREMPASHREFITLPTPRELELRLVGYIPPCMKARGYTQLQEWRAAGRPGGYEVTPNAESPRR
ncbi:MAG: tyrosine-type recombinase/integrase [Limisphaerales bacterium]